MEGSIIANEGMAIEPDSTSAPASERADIPPKVRTIACVAGLSLERGVPIEDVRDYLRDPDTVVWMDVCDPGPEELAMLLEEFGFHPLALEDVAKEQQRPKIDEYKGHLFVVTYGVVCGDDRASARPVELNLFIGRGYLVTVHRGRLPALEEAAARWTRGGPMLREGVGFLVYTVLDAVIDAYFPLLDAIEEEMQEREVELFTDFHDPDIQRLLKLKRLLFSLRRVLSPMRETLHTFLRPDHPYVSPATRVYFQDVYDHILRILDLLELQRESAAGATEAYLTLSSNRLNITMKRLTVITACVAILGAVFGAWGMNFQSIPLTEPWWGFWVVLAGAAGLVAAVVWVGRKREWL
jgi:magnesium transporter